MRKNERGLAVIAVLIVIAIVGAGASGLVRFSHSKPVLHKEVLKQGVPDYSTVNK